MGTYERSRTTARTTAPTTPAGFARSVAPLPSPVASQDPEEERLTVLPPIVWAAGIGGIVAVILLSS